MMTNLNNAFDLHKKCYWPAKSMEIFLGEYFSFKCLKNKVLKFYQMMKI